MKHRIIALTTVALLSACGEAPAPTQPNAVALVQGFSNGTATITAGALTTVSYTTVGASTFPVPAGVTSLTVVAVGGGGGGALLRPGGHGARVTSTLSVTPGQVLDLVVGNGTIGTSWSVGGGTATTIASGGTLIVIAGAGGGAGQYGAGGSAGGPGGAGGQGVNGSVISKRGVHYYGTGGMGGAGGVGGAGGTGKSEYLPNTGGTGGNGNGAGGSQAWYSGGGGGGWGGGGGGGPVSGGGAGGSLGPAGTTYASAGNGGAVAGYPITDAVAARGGNGSIQISFEATPIDNTPPVIVSVVAGTLGDNGWYTSNVAVTWTVTDAESAVSSSSGCSATSVTADTHGVTFTCTATSAGGTDSKSVIIQRDATKPTIGYTGNAGSYTVDQTVAITCSASDAMSGLASTTCANVGGDAYNFAIGSNSFSASAQDNAGNSNTASTSFTVVVDAGSVCALVQRWVSNAGVANSMCVKLRHGSYGAFRNELSAQSGKKISDANAAILLRLVNLLG